MRKKIAHWLDPDTRGELQKHKDVNAAAKESIANAVATIDKLRAQQDELAHRLAEAGVKINALRMGMKDMADALDKARYYVLDDLDDAEAMLEKLPLNSKKRPAAEACAEAVRVDYNLFARAMERARSLA